MNTSVNAPCAFLVLPYISNGSDQCQSGRTLAFGICLRDEGVSPIWADGPASQSPSIFSTASRPQHRTQGLRINPRIYRVARARQMSLESGCTSVDAQFIQRSEQSSSLSNRPLCLDNTLTSTPAPMYKGPPQCPRVLTEQANLVH